MKEIKIRTSNEYSVLIDSGLLGRSGELIRDALGTVSSGTVEMPDTDTKICIVSDSTVGELYCREDGPLQRSLKAAGFQVFSFIFDGGEDTKTPETLISIWQFLMQNHFSRNDVIVACGGGVPGDVAGFAAATYLRGLRYVQIPTSLLAAVDSSVGGKTAVNLPYGKNMAGAFRQPELVVFDTDTLDTLSRQQLLDGMAEVLKAGLIADRSITDDALKAGPEIFDNRNALVDLVCKAIDVKRRIVEDDETESGLRKLLNFGHTPGHAIEKCSGYAMPHGMAVAMGMRMMAAAQGGPVSQYINELLDTFGYPDIRNYEELTSAALAEAALNDKKTRGSTITLVCPDSPGHCSLKEIPVLQLEQIFRAGGAR